ncbi:uncharacterized protein MELLADRAFT_114818 [Melampsora larici-populina 98AG31]|uniref:Uncharacterized protein n=1 Tax=Melampsora larici-populina (strain 98AG31 / pathotype 3-4-7) TaxID=747676 RepID=F4R3G0_MELLP|nr:uncharacterized protein MELLADRAFT_114818 [Melampsora larici-populina 98AG31]EGG13175.1 hypothetical protein MELLADRAFT_114818 [Melampsora larici-populina 98AG31]
MSNSNSTNTGITEFLDSIYNPIISPEFHQNLNHDLSRRPFVTLTYAQSLDGKIAGVDGRQLRLSGNQSMKMTHIMISNQDRQSLEEAGARVIPITNGMNPSNQGLDLEKVFEVCKINGINRLMIEGGSSIISSCLNYTGDHPILNILVVTVSPYMVGEGLTVKTSNIDSRLSLLRHIQTKILGSDAVFAYTSSNPE